MREIVNERDENEQDVEDMTVEFIGGPLDGTRITDLAVVRLGPARVRVLDATYRAPDRPLVEAAT
jgi:hypothetical protein